MSQDTAQTKHRSLAEAFAELRKIAVEENYELIVSPRVDRPNAFLQMLVEEEEEKERE
jgi:hypothetical protein